MPDKDLFNGSQPKDDAKNFLKYVTNPTLPRLLEIALDKDPAFGGTAAGKIAPKNFPRTDLMNVFLTGIAGVNRPANANVGSEMLRLNTNHACHAGRRRRTRLGPGRRRPGGLPERPASEGRRGRHLAGGGGRWSVRGQRRQQRAGLEQFAGCDQRVQADHRCRWARRRCSCTMVSTSRRSRCCRSSRTCSRRRRVPAPVRTEEPSMKQFKSWLVLAGAVLALAACGGGGGGDGDRRPRPWAGGSAGRRAGEATQSVSGWIGYLAASDQGDRGRRSRAGRSDGGRGPASLPVDDEGEPVAPA